MKAGSLEDVLADVRRIDILARRLVTGVMAGAYLSVFRGTGLEFDTVREYAEGDPQRAVDWNVTARMGRPFVKATVEERDLNLLFLLDLSASMNGGYAAGSAREMAVRVMACLALAAVRNGDRVGLLAFGKEVHAYVAPRKGRHHGLRLVRDGLRLPATDRETRPSAALNLATRVVRRHAVLFLLSDFLFRDPGYEKALAAAASRHDVVAVPLLVPELDHLPRALALVHDPESGARHWIDGKSPKVRRAHAARVNDWREGVLRALRRAKVDRMDVPVPLTRGDHAVAGPILRFFRMRESRGTKR